MFGKWLNSGAAALFGCGLHAAVAFAEIKDYEGAIFSETLVFEVARSVNGQPVRETWFAQWIGNVYAKSLELKMNDSGSRIKRETCQNASWVAPQRHIWREGDEPYLTRTQKMRLFRLDHKFKKTRCQRVGEITRQVSDQAMGRAVGWIKSHDLLSPAEARDHSDMGSVEEWILANVPNVLSVRADNRRKGVPTPLSFKFKEKTFDWDDDISNEPEQVSFVFQ